MTSKYIDWSVLYGNESTGDTTEFIVKARTLLEAGIRGDTRLRAYIRREGLPEDDWWLRPGYPQPTSVYLREGAQN